MVGSGGLSSSSPPRKKEGIFTCGSSGGFSAGFGAILCGSGFTAETGDSFGSTIYSSGGFSTAGGVSNGLGSIFG